MKQFYLPGAFLLLVGLFSCKDDKKETTSPDVTTTQETIFQGDQNIPDSVREINALNLVEKGDYKNAIVQIDKLLAKDPLNPVWLYKKAEALEQIEDTMQAILHYQKAIESAGKFTGASARLATIYAEQGNQNALVICEDLLKDPIAFKIRSGILYTKGIYFLRTGQAEKALQIFDLIIREDYTFLDAYLEKGILYYDQKKYTEARKVFEKSTSVKNSFADGYYWTARCDEMLNNKPEAIDNFKRAIVLDTGFIEAREALVRLQSNQ
jgi:tetratricopeptide (TPR) repeat protein